MKPNKKLLEVANDFVDSAVKFIVWDSSDDMNQIECCRYAYAMLVKNTNFKDLLIEQFIDQYLPDAVSLIITEIENDQGEKISKNQLSCIASLFTIKP